MFTTDTTTTGSVVSTLGVLTCLAQNLFEDNHLDKPARAAARAEMRAILTGKRGIEAEKVAVRSAERCVAGVWN